jgi:hypothetical protein
MTDMEKDFSIQDKIIWHGKISSDLETCFYPSFYKDILKRESMFSENFQASFEDATLENLKNKFIPIYQTEIMSREKFTLEKNSIIGSLVERVEKNPSRYKFLFICSNDGELFGASMFSVLGNKLQMAFRAYKREIKINTLKHKASLDYWGEKLIREYGARAGLNVFSYGRDTHPYVGRDRVGLALYKLKTGTKPKVPDLDNPEKPVKTISIDDSSLLSQEEPVVFFSNPGDDEFYQNCFLYCPKNSLHESFINEFKIVCEWAGLIFKTVEY